MKRIKKITVRRNEKHNLVNFLKEEYIIDERLFNILLKARWALETILALTKGNGRLNPERNPRLKKRLNKGLICAIGCYEVV
jgi:hypothetical protein